MIFSAAASVLASTLLASTASALTKPIQSIRTSANLNGLASWQTLYINYNYGSPIMSNPINVYYIYYGNWTASQKSIVEDFTNNLQNSMWWGITKQYYSQASPYDPKVYVNGAIRVAKTVNDNYSLGANLDGLVMPQIVYSKIKSKALPEDPNGIYLVLTSKDVYHSYTINNQTYGFCTHYCGYHDSMRLITFTDIVYGYIGNGDYCPQSCLPYQNQQNSPNGDTGVDRMMSVIAHEITEAVTNPYPNVYTAWRDCNGNENGDKCSWSFGDTKLLRNNAAYNVVVGSRKYLLQQNWNLKNQACGLKASVF